MTNQEIKKSLEKILKKINDNGINAWHSDLEDYIEAVALENFRGDSDSNKPTIKYNGWLDDLEKLVGKL